VVKYRVDEVKLAWVDNGHKMWNVRVSRVSDDTKWALRTWARDELDAYNLALKKLEGADQ